MQTIQKDKERTEWIQRHAQRELTHRPQLRPSSAWSQLRASEVTRPPTQLPLGYPQAALRQELRKDIMETLVVYCNGKMTVATKDFSHLQEAQRMTTEAEERQRKSRVACWEEYAESIRSTGDQIQRARWRNTRASEST